MHQLLFGTGGIPLGTPKPSLVNGIKQIKKLELDCMEIEWVYGVRTSPSEANEIKKVATELKIKLSAHCPYYINLNAQDPLKLKASIDRILAAARIGNLSGVQSIIFHAAFYLGEDKILVLQRVKKRLAEIQGILKKQKNAVLLRPEITGKETQLGSLTEVLTLSRETRQVAPCIDFAHLYARTQGAINTYEKFADILKETRKKLGVKALQNLHLHVAGMEYGLKGEKKHLNLKESKLNYRALLKALKDYQVAGLLICESPNLEKDALLLKKTYQAI